jgi:general stress protein 26
MTGHAEAAPTGPSPDHPAGARDSVARLQGRIGELAIAMVTTTDRRYMPASRPLLTQRFEDDGVLWFFAPNDGSLATGIEANPRVSVAYCDPARGLYISLSGYARFVYDPERILTLWNGRLAAWFPEGPADPRLALLRVDVDHGEYWDERAGRMVRLLARAQAALRGEPAPLPAEHKRLDLRVRPKAGSPA